ncbi:flavin reductase (plasmid) [Rhodococcus oxybenzonivorans]|jgi:styrene monooxygenase reductase component|uniref:Flavin reductase n=2 Tax=Rhodococcus TaxID=1827 RepID=A0A2S2C5T1_9NOCA|nr:flavin reductase family protein [Rhodococcus oxybenzonivorans]AWK76138.1 flavin reductase [Rhodococcus oxybenzonivorans]BAL04133.1 flavin oxidoreductase [Rhodococcus sp. ST-5]
MTRTAQAHPEAAPTAPAPVDTVADSIQFRTSVALFATGIAVVTMDDGAGGVHGATINSFTSISLDPPTVMISLKPGYAHELISKSGWYGVSVLSESQQQHSRYFCGRRDADWIPEFVAGDYVSTLLGSLARFECKVFDTIDVHDHTLFLARVTRCESEDGSPLMFFASTYHQPVLGDR